MGEEDRGDEKESWLEIWYFITEQEEEGREMMGTWGREEWEEEEELHKQEGSGISQEDDEWDKDIGVKAEEGVQDGCTED